MEKAIREKDIVRFVTQCENDGFNDSIILSQILAFCKGQRGVILHDNCATLMDGEAEVKD